MADEYDFSELRDYLSGQIDLGGADILFDEPWAPVKPSRIQAPARVAPAAAPQPAPSAPPRPAAVSAALERLGRAASGRRTGALSFEGLRPRPDGRAMLLLSTNAPLTETLRVRLQLRAVASSAVPAAEQGLRLVGEAVLERLRGNLTALMPAGKSIAIETGGDDLELDAYARLDIEGN